MKSADYRSLIDQNQYLQITVEERKQALLLQLSCLKDIKFDFSFLGQYFKVQEQYKDILSNRLLNRQYMMLVDQQNQCQIGRYEERITQLQDLLASKEEEIQFKKNNRKNIKIQKPHLQNLMQLDLQIKIKYQLVKELAIKRKLQNQIVQLQKLIERPSMQDKQTCFSFSQLDLKVQQSLIQEVQRYQELHKLQINLSKELAFQTYKCRHLRQGYAHSHKNVTVQQINKNENAENITKSADNLVTNDNQSIKAELKHCQLSTKTISQTSDQD